MPLTLRVPSGLPVGVYPSPRRIAGISCERPGAAPSRAPLAPLAAGESPAQPLPTRDSSAVTQPQPCPAPTGAPPARPGPPSAAGQGKGGLHGQGDRREPAALWHRGREQQVQRGVGWLEGDGGPGSKVLILPPAMGTWGSRGATATLAGPEPSPLPVENPQQGLELLVRAACQHRGRHRAP